MRKKIALVCLLLVGLILVGNPAIAQVGEQTSSQITESYMKQVCALELQHFDYQSYELDTNRLPVRGIGQRILKLGMTLEGFNAAQGQIYVALDNALMLRKVTLEAKASLTTQEQTELDGLKVRFPTPVVSQPPRSTHFARITAFNTTAVKPLSVVRTWSGKDYYYNCYVTQDIVDAYLAGKLRIGDYVLVHFDDSGVEVATQKIYKTW